MGVKILKPVTVKEFEIDLICVYKEFENKKDNEYIHELSKSEYLSRINTLFEEYCKLKKINYVKYKAINRPIKVSLRRDINVSLFGLCIISYDTISLHDFLQFHYENYPDKSKFITLVKKYIYGFVKSNSPFGNKHIILQKIWGWAKEAKHKHTLKENEKIITLQISNINSIVNKEDKTEISIAEKNIEIAGKSIHNVAELVWQKESDKDLKTISKRLYKLNCTNDEYSFYKAIKNSETTVWHKDINYLIHLMYVLVNEYRLIKTRKTSGYFKCIQSVFDYPEKANPKFRMAAKSSRIKLQISIDEKQKTEKFIPERNFVKDILKGIKKIAIQG